jgi:thioredoxin-dependent peroxiredoxin
MELLKVGDQAPEIEFGDHEGKVHRISDYRGSKLIVYFYPKDNTPGCTDEACNLRDNYGLLLSKGFKIIGISADPLKSHQRFAGKFELPFPLIPDTERKVIEAFGVWGPKKFMGRVYDGIHRVTYIIDEQGLVEKVFEKVDTKRHAEQIIKEYE